MIATAADLHFTPETHEYRLPDGTLVPSVTRILKETGVATDFDEIAGFSHFLAARIDEGQKLGTAVHADCHAFDDDDLDWSSVDPRVLPYLVAWECFRENFRARPIARERVVYNPDWHYCGTLDGIFEIGQRLVLIDIKIGRPEDAGAQYQTAAYAEAYRREHHDFEIEERWAVQLTPEHVIPYRVDPYAGWNDFRSFSAFVTTFYAQAARRRTR